MRQRYSLNVSVFVIVTDAEKVLLLRRFNTGWKDGYFSLPAGGHDGNETLAQAAVRELQEETGLIAAPEDMKLVHTLHCNSGDSGGEWLGAFFCAERWSGKPTLMEADKHDHIGWFPCKDLPNNIIAYTQQGIQLGLSGIGFSTYGWPSA